MQRLTRSLDLDDYPTMIDPLMINHIRLNLILSRWSYVYVYVSDSADSQWQSVMSRSFVHVCGD